MSGNEFNEEEEGENEVLILSQSNKADNKTKLILTVLNRLIQIKNIDLNCRENDYTLLSFACETNEIDMVLMLIKSGKVNVNSYSPNNGDTPLMIAIENESIEIAKLLINLPKTNINFRNYNGKTALIIAVEKYLQEVVNLIINNERFDSEENNDDKNKSFETTLINAVNKEDKEKIELIIKHPSFDPDKSQIKAALFTSIVTNNISIFKSLLLRINNDVNICSQSQLSLLLFSINYNRDQIVEEIINNKNFDLNKNNILFAFIQTYQLNEQINFLKQLQQQQKDDDGKSYSHHKLVTHASLKSMNLIYEFDKSHNHSIDFSQLLPDGKSFFTVMNPTLNNNGNVAYFLLKHGVDPDKPDNFGKYPLNYCIENDLNGAAVILIRTGRVDLNRRFIINISYAKNSTYLHLAASQKSSEVLAELLDLNIIDINSKNVFGETPLIFAIKNKSLNNIKLLFSKDNMEYEKKSNNDIIEVAKRAANYFKNDEVQLKSKKDYLDYLIHIISSSKFYRFLS